MDPQYSLKELADLTGVEPRTIRWYISEGLLRGPEALGRNAYYTEHHRKRLDAIRELKDTYGMSLAEIRKYVLMAGDEDIQIVPLRPGRAGWEPMRRPPMFAVADEAAAYNGEEAWKRHEVDARSPVRRLVEQLEQLAASRRVRRTARATRIWEIEILPEIALQVRGEYSRSELAQFEAIADCLRTLLLGGDGESGQER